MRVSKRGNNLSIRLPVAVVEALNLREGDEIEIRIVGARALEIARTPARDNVLELMRSLRRPLPPGWIFDCGDAVLR